MIPFLTPKYIKQAKLYIKGAEKRIAYNRDLWSAEDLAKIQDLIQTMKDAVKIRAPEIVKTTSVEIDKFCGLHCPPTKDAWMQENVEVILVAVVIALGIRTFFLQPFTIPTSSMFPTLNGITGKATTEEPPNFVTQAVEFATKGRSYCNVIAKDDERITDAVEGTRYKFFSYTTLKTDKGNTYEVNTNMAVTQLVFFPHGIIHAPLKKGEPVARGYTDTGDHVFVDKMSYHFRKPTRGEVFVFTTQNISGIQTKFTQYYIKRLAGVPKDKMRIDAPTLYINDKPAEEAGFRRVMEGHYPNPGGYQGYSNTVSPGLTDPTDSITVPDKNYYALGDNSYMSSDSRAWGFVPEENLVGTGILVYWPFMRDTGTHFGIIK